MFLKVPLLLDASLPSPILSRLSVLVGRSVVLVVIFNVVVVVVVDVAVVVAAAAVCVVVHFNTAICKTN